MAQMLSIDDMERMVPSAQPATPRGLSIDEMEKLSAQEAMPDWQRKLGIVGEGVVNAATSVLGAPVDIYNAGETLITEGQRGIARLFGMNRAVAELQPNTMPYGGSQWLRDQAKGVGIPGTDMKLLGNPQFKPETSGERILSSATEGATASAMLPIGAAGMAARLAAGAAAGTGSEVAKQSYTGGAIDRTMRAIDPTVGEVAAEVVPIAGALAGGMIGGGAYNTAVKAGKAISGKSGLAGDYAAEGVTPRLAGDVADSDFLRRSQAALRDMPGASGRIRDAAQQTMDDLSLAVERRAGQMGTATNATEAGQALQSGANRYHAGFNNEAKRRYAILDRYLPSTERVPLNNTVAMLDDLSSSMDDAQNLAKVLTSPLHRELRDAVAKDLATDGMVKYATLKRFRTEIGDKLSGAPFHTDTSTRELKALWGALSDDMQAAAAAKGPLATNAFREANTYFKQGIGVIEDTAARVAAKGVTPEKAFDIVMSGAGKGGTGIQEFRKLYTPDEWGMLSSAVLRNMGKATAGAQSAAGDTFSPARFLTNWNNLAPQAKAVLADGDVGTLEAWNRLARIAQSMKDTQSLANSSRTAGTSYFMNILSTLGGAAGAAAGAGYGGGAGAAAGATAGLAAGMAGGLGAPWAAAKLMTNPAFVRWVATPVGADGIPAATRRLATVAASAPEIRSELRLFLDHVQGGLGSEPLTKSE